MLQGAVRELDPTAHRSDRRVAFERLDEWLEPTRSYLDVVLDDREVSASRDRPRRLQAPGEAEIHRSPHEPRAAGLRGTVLGLDRHTVHHDHELDRQSPSRGPNRLEAVAEGVVTPMGDDQDRHQRQVGFPAVLIAPARRMR